ncbi:hypothetical protein C2869_09020 [Saccharobesus litoralis]|uniref:Diguanylate cyclase/phosphodiesterase n=1 Tax=Saccharobesus litoralis TaxID=2172099 RepID=A0A2S0VQV1_9ALTE|nr:EAL domain-containing protein [Saccharobesus litoralis]AWB66562.1 hypothetical protein C2869_09020 [Saccharobesus litoralis]
MSCSRFYDLCLRFFLLLVGVSFSANTLANLSVKTDIESWQTIENGIRFAPNVSQNVQVSPQPEQQFLYVSSPKIQINVPQHVTPLKGALGQVYKLTPETTATLQLTSRLPVFSQIYLLSAEQLVSLQQHQTWVWGIIVTILVVLATYALISGSWWQQTMQYWFTALSVTALLFISLHSGLLNTWFGLPQGVASSSLYSLSIVLMMLCFVGLSKTVLVFKQNIQRYRRFFNILIVVLAAIAICTILLPTLYAYYLSFAACLVSSLICSYFSYLSSPLKQGKNSQRGYLSSWLLFSFAIGFMLMISILPVNWSVNFLLPAAITLHIFSMALSLAERHVGQLRSTVLHAQNRRVKDASLQYAALHDKLTGLPSQLALEKHFQQLTQANKNHEIALVVIRINNFAQLNHTLGFSTGDMVLLQMARRLNRLLLERQEVICIEQNQAQEKLALAALNGVRFAFLLDVSKQSHLLENLSLQLRQQLPEPISMDGIIVENDISLGAAYYPNDGKDLTALLNSAQTALDYGSQTNQLLTEFSPEQEPITPEQKQLALELKQAINDDQLKLMVHPIVEINYRKVVAGEVLIRWRHPQRGLISPQDFIHVAEKTGVIYGLTRWVLSAAIQELAKWQQANIQCQISVNISNRDLLQHELIDFIAGQLNKANVAANKLILEIREGAITADPQQAHDAIIRLDKLGVHTVIDDFGTGLSALGLIRELPLKGLKVDRSFVKSLTEGDTAKTIVNTVVDVGRNLGLDVVAEGVEDEEVEDKLRRMGCNLSQGFLYSQPFDLAGFVSWTQQWQQKQKQKQQQTIEFKPYNPL